MVSSAWTSSTRSIEIIGERQLALVGERHQVARRRAASRAPRARPASAPPCARCRARPPTGTASDSRSRAAACRADRATSAAPRAGSSAAPPARARCGRNPADRRRRRPCRIVSACSMPTLPASETEGPPCCHPRPDDDLLCPCRLSAAASNSALRRPASPASRCATAPSLERRIGEADVLVISGLWRDALLDRAPASCASSSRSAPAPTSSGARRWAQRGIRLASARGVNASAVAEHAMALILALARRLPEARDNQAQARLARHDRRPHPARGRARRQDPADRRARRDRRPAGAARQGVRHAGDRAAPEPGAAAPARPTQVHGLGALGGAAARGRFRRAHLPAHPGDREPDRRRRARPDEALGLSRQRRARPRASTRRRWSRR